MTRAPLFALKCIAKLSSEQLAAWRVAAIEVLGAQS